MLAKKSNFQLYVENNKYDLSAVLSADEND